MAGGGRAKEIKGEEEGGLLGSEGPFVVEDDDDDEDEKR